MRISNSFSEGEIQVLDFILSTLLRGGSPAMATRNKDFASLCRKVVSMKTRVEEKKRKTLLEQKSEEREAPAQSSVGRIEAADVADDADESLEGVG
jgi:hypothetical protein